MPVPVSALWHQVASRLGPRRVDVEVAQRAVLRAAGYAWCVSLGYRRAQVVGYTFSNRGKNQRADVQLNHPTSPCDTGMTSLAS